MTRMSKSEMLGRERGKAVASWVSIDSSNAERILLGIEDGDPEIMNMIGPPSPLSGEMGGESIIELFGRQPNEHMMQLFESAYDDAYWQEIERTARYHLPEDADPYLLPAE